MDPIIRKLVLLVLLAGGWATPGLAQPYTVETVPNPKQSRSAHYVSNPDRILSDRAVHQLDSMLGRLEDSTTAQVAVVCVNSIGEYVPNDFATALFRRWGLGYRQKNNGLLVLLVKDQHRIELETGYGLEGILPDAICRRIQSERMVPLAKTGDFDGAMLAGVQAVARLISAPEAAAEVYDRSKFTAPNQPLTNAAVFVLFLLLVPVLLALRLVMFFVRRSNPIAGQLERSVSQTKGRWAWALLVYGLMPLGVGLAVVQFRHPLSLHGWQILLMLYTCVGAVIWDGRRRRKNAFQRLFGAMTEPERYVRLKAARLNGWGTAFLFPIPFWWQNRQEALVLDALRNHPRHSDEGDELNRVSDNQKMVFLATNQKIEQKLGSVDYDVWRNETYDITQTIGYENLADTVHQYCDRCRSKALYLASDRVVKAATTEREGRGMHAYACKACGHHRDVTYLMARIQRAAPTRSASSGTTSSASTGWSNAWSGSSGSSSGSSSNWGGGSSGGGGAGSSW